MAKCKLCAKELDDVIGESAPNRVYRAKCARCGAYSISDAAVSSEPDAFVRERLHLISAVARRSSERGSPLLIRQELLTERSEFEARILSVCPRNTQEKMDCILAYIAEKSSYPGQEIEIDTDDDYPLFYCKEGEELRFYLRHVHLYGLVVYDETMSGPGQVTLGAEGWTRVEEQAKPNIESKQAFVAMWFDDEVKSAYSEGIAKLEEDTGFSMLRIDMSQFNDKICDKILAEIRRSRFLIADVTGHRQGVYFEAGFAMGLGLPVIWTCREDQIEECHFDTRQYNHITWKDADELRQKLKDRILATIGKAPER